MGRCPQAYPADASRDRVLGVVDLAALDETCHDKGLLSVWQVLMKNDCVQFCVHLAHSTNKKGPAKTLQALTYQMVAGVGFDLTESVRVQDFEYR